MNNKRKRKKKKGRFDNLLFTKRPILLIEINTGLGRKSGRFSKPMALQNKQE
jgi:hypothetical protein